MRAVLVASLFLVAQAQAQTPAPAPVPLPLQVERLAPQLVAFAGSQANFQNLVNGLALGLPVTLTTAGADGVTQTVTFTSPGGAVSSPGEIARMLETARQQLIATGVATPSAQQIGTTLAGTNVPVTVGVAPPPQPAGPAAAGGGVPSPAAQIQSRNTPLGPRINTSDSGAGPNTSASPTPAAPAIGAPTPPPAVSREGAQPRPNAPHR